MQVVKLRLECTKFEILSRHPSQDVKLAVDMSEELKDRHELWAVIHM